MTARQHRSATVAVPPGGADGPALVAGGGRPIAVAVTPSGPSGSSRALRRSGSTAGAVSPGDADGSSSGGRRRHRLAGVALAAFLVLGPAGFAACGGDDGDDEAEAGDTTETSESETTETTAGDEAEAGGAADEDAAGEAVSTVFDSAVPFDDKVALIEGGEAHRADHEAYVGAANGVGGITVEPTDVAVDGDTATVTYRVLFGGNEAYADLTMDVTRVDGEWIVPTSAFCGFLASARTPCAAG
jgi:ketosteroid isomerase-like protein